jgi:hypothetical protein
MNRRGFIGTLIGGIAASAAVRTWPFRVYSFPSNPVQVDFGYDEIIYGGARGGGKSAAIFALGGIPLFESKHCPPDRIYTFNRDLSIREQYRLAHPDIIKRYVESIKLMKIEGISV